MKKILSLMLVVCMVVACVAICPASAKEFRGNLLTYTEDNCEKVYGAPPWQLFYGDAGQIICFIDWLQDNYVTDWANVVTLTNESDALMPGSEEGDRAIKVDLDKLNPLDSSSLLGWRGLLLDVYTANVEAGKTYTFFFKVKASDTVDTDVTKLYVGPNTLAACGTSNILDPTSINSTGGVAFDITHEWQTIKYTFTAADTLVADGNGNLITGLEITISELLTNTSGFIYIDGLALVEGSDVDAEEFYESKPDTDNDGIINEADPDVDGDGIANRFDRDADGDGIKNVWDKDMDNDGTPNVDDDTPFGV